MSPARLDRTTLRSGVAVEVVSGMLESLVDSVKLTTRYQLRHRPIVGALFFPFLPYAWGSLEGRYPTFSAGYIYCVLGVNYHIIWTSLCIVRVRQYFLSFRIDSWIVIV